jgi:hypothetical protein
VSNLSTLIDQQWPQSAGDAGEVDGAGLGVGEIGRGGDVRKCPRMSGI